MKTTEETINEIKTWFEHNKSKGGGEFAILQPIEPYDDVDWELINKEVAPATVDFFKETNQIFIKKS